MPRKKIYRSKKTGEEHSITIYADRASGGSADRDEFCLMLRDSDNRKFSELHIISLDRATREGASNLMGYLERLKRNGVSVHSFREPWVTTSDDNPTTELLLTIFGWLAKMERIQISSRVKAGMARAKAEGKHMGRPKNSKDKKRRIRSGYIARHRKAK